MRAYEVFLRSGAKAEFEAEHLNEESHHGEKIYFYSDTSLTHVVAYFNRTDIVGIIYGPDKPVSGRRKIDSFRG